MAAELWPSLAASACLRVANQGLGMAIAATAAGAVGALAGGLGKAAGLKTMVFAVAAMALAKAVSRYAEQVLGHGFAFALLARMRSRAYLAMRRLAPAWPERELSGEVVSRVTADIDRVEVFYAHTIGPAIAYALLSPAGTIALAALAGPAAAAALAAGLLLVGLVLPYAAYRAGKASGDGLRRGQAAVQAALQENLRAGEDLRQLGARGLRLAELAALEDGVARAEDRLARIAAAKDLAVELCLALTLLGVAILSRGRGLGPAATALALAASSFAPALGLGRAFDDLPETMASSERYFELVDTPPAVAFAPGAAVANRPSGPSVADDARDPAIPAYALRGLGFERGGRPVLSGLDLIVKPGERVCIMGPSGSGKSTLLKLMARFYDPTEGSLELFGRPLRDWPEAELRAAVSWLDQAPFFFEGSVRDNLRLLLTGLPDARLLEALELVRFLPGEAGRLDRILGPRGSGLSGGERKRLGLARVLLRGSPVVLLDEAFSSLDRASRAEIRSLAFELLKGRTVIECSHEPEDQEGADRTVRLG
jgi:ABC-type transport system involved in cytochrome bd biosynthesis fused ATPase/permease subunit